MSPYRRAPLVVVPSEGPGVMPVAILLLLLVVMLSIAARDAPESAPIMQVKHALTER